MCIVVACTCVEYVPMGMCPVLVHTGFCTCVCMHVHANLVRSALSSVFEKFIRRQAVPEEMETAVVFPNHGAAWVLPHSAPPTALDPTSG